MGKFDGMLDNKNRIIKEQQEEITALKKMVSFLSEAYLKESDKK